MTLRDPHGADGDVACLQVEPKNPHLPAAAPAGLLSRKVTGEVSEAAAAVQSNTKGSIHSCLTSSNRDEVPHAFSYHWVQGSPLPKEARNPSRVSHLIIRCTPGGATVRGRLPAGWARFLP